LSSKSHLLKNFVFADSAGSSTQTHSNCELPMASKTGSPLLRSLLLSIQSCCVALGAAENEYRLLIADQLAAVVFTLLSRAEEMAFRHY
jgi:hypothetical protein